MSKRLFCLLMFGCFHIGNSQISDTLKAVSVFSTQDSLVKMSSPFATVPHYQLNDFLLQQMGVIDIGEALKFVPGANIKDYGGIGGLKTINYRSLGSAHTGLEIDGISESDKQSGTINLANQSIFGIESLEMSTGQVQHDNAFATAYLKANMISVSNVIASPLKHKTEVRTLTEFQSIHSVQNGILVKQKIGKRFAFGGQAMYRFGSGVYKYQVKNGQQVIDGMRSAADLSQLQLSAAGRYHYKKLSISILGGHSESGQNLPGAVVFYNPKNKETLHQINDKLALITTYKYKKQSISAQAFGSTASTIYFQDFVLNSQGFIEHTYQQNQIGTGLMYKYYLGADNQFIFFGSDIINSKLDGNQYESSPFRASMNSVLGITKWIGKVKLQGNISHQQVKDESIESKQNYSHFSPFASISFIPFKNRSFRIRSFYKNSFRMPSFNDLYYRSIGNINLSPETANLINIGLVYASEFKGVTFETTVDYYHNTVDNKIIAIPTKNLFNWSMQNIGKTQGRGIDLSLILTKNLAKSKLILSTNQSINKSTDITAVDGFTYGHQLPYTPIYYASYLFNFQHKYFTSALNVLHSGSRFVLTENIAHNYLSGFFDFGFNVAHTFKLKKGQSITCKTQVNNVLNKNYEVVRSFPMPGRYYILTLKYNLKQ